MHMFNTYTFVVYLHLIQSINGCCVFVFGFKVTQREIERKQKEQETKPQVNRIEYY